MELMITVTGKITTYSRKNMDSKIIDMATCKTCNKVLLDAEYAMLIRYYEQTAETRAL